MTPPPEYARVRGVQVLVEVLLALLLELQILVVEAAVVLLVM